MQRAFSRAPHSQHPGHKPLLPVVFTCRHIAANSAWLLARCLRGPPHRRDPLPLALRPA